MLEVSSKLRIKIIYVGVLSKHNTQKHVSCEQVWRIYEAAATCPRLLYMHGCCGVRMPWLVRLLEPHRLAMVLMGISKRHSCALRGRLSKVRGLGIGMLDVHCSCDVVEASTHAWLLWHAYAEA